MPSPRTGCRATRSREHVGIVRTRRLRTFVTRHPAGARATLHRHSAPYVALVLEGGYEECSVDGAWRCEPGDLVVHPPMHLHMNRFSARRTRVLNIVLVARRCTSLPPSYGVWRPRDPDSIRSLSRMDGDAIAEVLAHAEQSRALAPYPALSKMAGGLTIDPHCRVGAAADQLGMTREHASRIFRRHFGLPPSVFRSEQRFRGALTLLIDSTTPLASIALEAGYADQAHLTRDFKARTGMSPGAFRRSFRTDQEITSVQS